MLKKKKTTASGKLVLAKSVRRHWTSEGCPLSADRSGTETAQPQNEILCSKGLACLFSPKMKRTSERIVKFHSLAQFVSNFSDNSVSSLFFRASRIFCPKAVKSSIGIIVHLNNIVSFWFI